MASHGTVALPNTAPGVGRKDGAGTGVASERGAGSSAFLRAREDFAVSSVCPPTMNQPPYAPYPSPPPQAFAPAVPASPVPAPYAQPGYGYGYGQPAPAASQWGAPQPAIDAGGSTLRWFVLGSLIGAGFCAMAGGVLAGVADNPDDAIATVGGLVTMLAFPALLAYAVLALVWIAKSWGMLPPMARMTQSGRVVTPGQAVGFLFVPFYNLYWYFVVSMGLCDALNRQLAAYGSPKRAPRGLAMAAAIVQVIPYLNLFVGPLLWLPFMFMTDGAKREYARLSGVRA
jgi:hypothetical protein